MSAFEFTKRKLKLQIVWMLKAIFHWHEMNDVG